MVVFCCGILLLSLIPLSSSFTFTINPTTPNPVSPTSRSFSRGFVTHYPAFRVHRNVLYCYVFPRGGFCHGLFVCAFLMVVRTTLFAIGSSFSVHMRSMAVLSTSTRVPSDSCLPSWRRIHNLLRCPCSQSLSSLSPRYGMDGIMGSIFPSCGPHSSDREVLQHSNSTILHSYKSTLFTLVYPLSIMTLTTKYHSLELSDPRHSIPWRTASSPSQSARMTTLPSTFISPTPRSDPAEPPPILRIACFAQFSFGEAPR